MIYNDFKGMKLSALGFGMMRLPLLQDGKTVDRELTAAMIDYAISHGVNYFDTAVPYHSGMSEIVAGEILQRYPRESYMLADKFPGHQHAEEYDPQEVFESQLRKCRTEYFDFYLLHNVCESSADVYFDKKWGILDYFVKQKENGRIKHLGFSSHADLEMLRTILDSEYGKYMEFCQIQLNYVDWTLQKAREKVALLESYGIPVWVMEPLRGGRLASMPEEVTAEMRKLRPEESTAAWAFRWLQRIPQVKMILSGMSDMEQMKDNIRTFESFSPLNEEENSLVGTAAAGMHRAVPCTACRYCCDGCPAGLDIPVLVAAYNDLSLQFSLTPMMRLEAMPEEKRPSACLQCGSCESICPQKIAVPEVLSKLAGLYEKSPKWSEICVERAAEAAKLEASYLLKK